MHPETRDGRPAFVFIELPRLGGVIYFPERRR
jgi:hypothetical protein